jgi:hypothetical protein
MLGAGGGGDANDRDRGDRDGDPAEALDGALAALALQSFIEGAIAGQALIVQAMRLAQFWLPVLEVEGRHIVLPGSFLSGSYNPSRFTWVPKTEMKAQKSKYIMALLSISGHILINIGATRADRRRN